MVEAIREVYGKRLTRLGEKHTDIVVLDADVSGSTKSGIFGKTYPDRFYNVGIAEANMAGMAAGMATVGKIPFINTFASFLVLRGGDPIRSLIGYGNLNVKLAGAYAGLSDSYDGATHHAITDMALMQAIPNMVVLSPCDPVSTRAAVDFAVSHKGPVYLRLSRAAMPDVYSEGYKLGKGAVMHGNGEDVALVATGYMVHKALAAAKILAEEGIEARVVDIQSIKPIDHELLQQCSRETKIMVTCEEHNVIGGLGSTVTQAIAPVGTKPIGYIGVQDTFTATGDYEELLEHFGMQPDAIVKKAKEMLK